MKNKVIKKLTEQTNLQFGVDQIFKRNSAYKLLLFTFSDGICQEFCLSAAIVMGWLETGKSVEEYIIET